MSTGMTAAQVAHGLFAWLMDVDWAGRSAWLYSGRRFSIREASASAVADSPGLSICELGSPK